MQLIDLTSEYGDEFTMFAADIARLVDAERLGPHETAKTVVFTKSGGDTLRVLETRTQIKAMLRVGEWATKATKT